jgi:ATP-dependent DNA helicase RecQ
VIGSFDRPNLRLAVRRADDEHRKLDAVLELVRIRTAEPAGRPGLLYTASRKDSERLADSLRESGVRAAAYHAGLLSRFVLTGW